MSFLAHTHTHARTHTQTVYVHVSLAGATICNDSAILGQATHTSSASDTPVMEFVCAALGTGKTDRM